MPKEINPILKAYIHIARGIAATFGSNCEVVLHDFGDMENSIVVIENGHVTGRSVDTPLPEYSLQKIERNVEGKDLINYTSKSTIGRELKSTTMFIKDDNGKSVGCLCINFDMTELVMAKNAISDIIQISEEEVVERVGAVSKVNDVLQDMVKDTIENFGRPVIYLSKEEKVQIVSQLDDKGIFLIKGAIDYVANALQVSRYTIYNYLDEIRVNK